MTTKLALRTRFLIERDWPEVLTIEASNPDPFTEDDLRQLLRCKNIVGLVAEIGENVVGYAVYARHRRHLELVRLVAHPDHRRQRVGTALVCRLLSKIDSSHKRNRISVVVLDDNLGAHLFLKANGFLAAACRGEAILFHRFSGV